MKITPDLLHKIKDIQEQYDYIYLGGSIALILQNAISPREVSDVDLISTKYSINIFKVLNIGKINHFRLCYHEGIKWELFKNTKAEYILINGLKLSPVDEIFDWKLNKSTKQKHQIDYDSYKNASISRN